MLYFKKPKILLLMAVLSILFFASPSYAGNYTVQSNDSIYKIAKLFKTTTSNIKQSNNLKNNIIYPGQILKVPSHTYSVKSGDSLYKISQKFDTSLYSIRKANNKWNNYIYPSMRLNIPGVSSVIAYTSSELDLLAKLIMAETDGQPYNAKVGVGAVVVNRVQSKSFPNSISSVIYQKINGYYQFTPVENGWINRPASQEAKNAAYEALIGSDPSYGALFYFDDSTTNRWIWSKPIATRIGRMVFSY